MTISETRISQLCDMACVHIAYGRHLKALRIMQFLRENSGHCTVYNLQVSTGFRLSDEQWRKHLTGER